MRGWGALDLALGALYAWLALRVVPARAPGFTIGLLAVAGLLALSGVTLVAGVAMARRVATVACAAAIGFGAVVAALLAWSAAYLRGVYGALGQVLGWGAIAGGGVMLLLLVAPAALQLRALRRARR